MDKQGELGNLEGKPKAELLELLSRQEKLLSNQKLLNMLPDKGQRVKLLAESLQKLLEKHDGMVDDAADLLEKMEIGRAQTDDPQATPNPFLKTDPPTTARNMKASFKPYRTLKCSTIPEELTHRRGTTVRRDCTDRLAEVSAAAVPPLKHPGVQAVSLAEASQLLQKQRSKVEALQAEQAADRLAQRLHIQMGEYRPDTRSTGSYRDCDDSESSEDDRNNDIEDDIEETAQEESQHEPNG